MLGVVVFLALLLLPSITVYLQFKEELDFSFGIYGFRFRPQEKKSAKEDKGKKHKKDKGSPDVAKDEAPEKQADKKSFSQIVEIVSSTAKSIFKGSEWLYKHLRVKRLQVCILVATEDAAKTAITYGRMYAAVYGALGVLDSLVKLEVKRIAIACSFTRDEPVYDISCKVKLRVIFLLFAAFAMLWTFLKSMIFKRASQPVAPGSRTNDKSAANPIA